MLAHGRRYPGAQLARLKNSDEEEGRYDGSKTWPWWRGSYPVCGVAVFLLSGVEGLTRCRKAGPGIVTGAADDDPSGIATYSQVGAQFGFAMLWTMLFSYPLMAGIQEISAWIGRVTGIGIAGNIRRHYSAWVLYPVVALLLVANVINLGADISAMGSALKLLVGGSALFYSVVFGLFSVITAIYVPYRYYAQLLKWSALVLLVYVATAFVAHVR